ARGSTTARTAESSVHATTARPPTKAMTRTTITAPILSRAAAAAPLLLELDGPDRDLEDLAVAEDAHADLPADAFADHQALEIARLLDRRVVHVEDQVLGAQAGRRRRAPLDDLDDLH